MLIENYQKAWIGKTIECIHALQIPSYVYAR